MAKLLIQTKMPQKFNDMKNEEPISKIFGASQLEMAMVLKIKRTQWSMFELGKRNLPVSAKLQMSEMLNHVQSPKSKNAKKQLLSAQQQDNTQQKLEALLRENDYQLQTVERKIAGIQKKQAEAVAALQLVDFLAPQEHKEDYYPGLLQMIERKAKRKAEENNDVVLITHQIKQAVLQHEEKLLRAALTALS